MEDQQFSTTAFPISGMTDHREYDEGSISDYSSYPSSSSLGSSCDGDEISDSESSGSVRPRSDTTRLAGDGFTSNWSERAAQAADRCVRRLSENSKFLDPEKEDCVPKFHFSQIIVADLLGQGSFNDVFDVQGINVASAGQCRPERKLSTVTATTGRSSIQSDWGWDGDENEGEDGISIVNEESTQSNFVLPDEQPEESATSVSCNNGYIQAQESAANREIVLKRLNDRTIGDGKTFAVAAADLVYEMKLLATMDHPNIVKLHGCAYDGQIQEEGYFLLIDRLHGTLEDKIQIWKSKVKKNASSVRRKVFRTRNSYHKALFIDRLKAAVDVASGLSYLHSNNIVYRDLKPENVGFSRDGRAVIFDFGLARELTTDRLVDDGYDDPEAIVESGKGMYDMTGGAGTRRYMAPEVVNHLPYNLATDVYAFSLLLWEVCTLEKPFLDMDQATHTDFVIMAEWRPPMDDPSWSPSLRSTIEWGWKGDPEQRPPMRDVYNVLTSELSSYTQKNVKRSNK